MGTLQDILREYEARRASALLLADERKQAAYAAMPELEQLDSMRRELAFGLGIRLRQCRDKGNERRRTADAIAALDEKKARLLADHGLPGDYLQPRYACARCADTGYVHGGMCACLKARLDEARYGATGLDPDARFSRFRDDIYPDERQRRGSMRAMELSVRYAESLSFNGARGILILGKAGLGKSFLLSCIGNAAFDNGTDVMKLSAYALVERKLASINAGAKAPDLLFPGLLILDDLGTEPHVPNITLETLFSTINERQKAHLPIAIGGNLTPENILDFYGENIFTRITSPALFSVIALEGSDLRRSGKV